MATRIGIGKAGIGGPDDSLRVTLGSCVGVCIVQPSRSLFGVAHVLLPTRGETSPGEASRFADTAVPFLMRRLDMEKRTRDTVAFVAGGSSMFTNVGQRTHVGQENIDSLLASLDEHRIRIVGRDTGGECPRQLLVSGPTRQVLSIHMEDEVEAVEWPLPPGFAMEKSK